MCANGSATLVAGLVVVACGTGSVASLPPEGGEESATPPPAYTRDREREQPATSPPSPSPTFAALYRDIFSINGAARCQHSSCHGGSDGNAGLSMGTDAWSVYTALTSYKYRGKRLVAPVPGGDARSGSALLAVTSPRDGIMPRIDEEVENRPLTPEEWGRLETWLATGAAF